MATDLASTLARLGAPAMSPGALIGLAVCDEDTVAVAGPTGEALTSASVVAELDSVLRPRWAVWSTDDLTPLIARGVRLARAWELDAVHRILHGGWQADPVRIWCTARGLDRRTAPMPGQLDLAGGTGGDGDKPVRPDGHLQPEWVDGAWRHDANHALAWAGLTRALAAEQENAVAALQARGDASALARAESTAALLATELAHDGLPVDIPTAEAIIADSVGPRPRSEAELQAGRDARDQEVLRHVPGVRTDLRNPADVKAMLRRVGIDVADTRAWRLEALRDQHPVVDALLHWRKAERMGTTFGYTWLDQYVRDGRLRGEWSGSDGAAGRMTASNGLHNLPAELRPAVRAEPGHVFVRADLGQIEPRVLAAVSGDEALIRAAHEDDLYAPVAARLKVERARAKVAVLAAMYGQTSGTAGEALRGMETGYPVAMKFLADAARSGMEGRDLRTYGGRLVRMWDIEDAAGEQRSAAAARGRYARNAMVQGAAAELFKVWAVTVRARGADLDARIVLCLHDELLVHVPAEHGEACAQLLHDCLAEAAHRWQRGAGVRFVADVSVVPDWASAKA